MSEQTVAAFWNAMASNDFSYASTWLHPDFEYYIPQTKEYLQGRDNFAALNAAYPTDGVWRFRVESIVSNGETAVSDVEITDGSFQARAITFHTFKAGLILQQKEYWPESYTGPEWRKKWVQYVDKAPF